MRGQRLAHSSRSTAALVAHAWMALFCAIHFPAHALAHDDAQDIRTLIGATWDKPDSKVDTDPVVVSGDFAVASWTQGPHGGRALLRRDHDRWSVVLCSGDPLKHASWLAEAGVPKPDADEISKRLDTAEKLISPERRAKFSLFEGTVSGEPPSHHPANPHPHDH